VGITWEDTPGSTLPSRREAIGFTSDRDVTDIRVIYEEERAYDGTDFLPPYESSEKNGNGFQLKRTGGWPKKFTVRPTEEPEPPPAPTPSPWGTLYEVDYSALENASPSDGVLAIDGLLYTVKGATTGLTGGQTVTPALVNGKGLRLEADSGSAGLDIGSNGTLAHACWWLPFANIAGYEPDAPVLVQYQLFGETGNVAALAGISSTADTTDAVSAGERQYETLSGPWHPSGTTNTARIKNGGAAAASANTNFGNYNSSNPVWQGAVLTTPWLSIHQNAAYAGTIAARDAMAVFGTVHSNPARTNPGLLFMIGHVSGSSAIAAYIAKLKIMQTGA
jgi:hypothetical protein